MEADAAIHKQTQGYALKLCTAAHMLFGDVTVSGSDSASVQIVFSNEFRDLGSRSWLDFSGPLKFFNLIDVQIYAYASEATDFSRRPLSCSLHVVKSQQEFFFYFFVDNIEPLKTPMEK